MNNKTRLLGALPMHLWRAPSCAEINTAETQEKAEIKQP
jgi:hypothetical protein